MFDGFPDVLVFLDVWISGFVDFWIPRRIILCGLKFFFGIHVQHNQSVLFSVFLMFESVDIGGAARLFFFIIILSLGVHACLLGLL